MTATHEVRNRTWATNPGVVRRHLQALEVLAHHAPVVARAVVDFTQVLARRSGSGYRDPRHGSRRRSGGGNG